MVMMAFWMGHGEGPLLRILVVIVADSLVVDGVVARVLRDGQLFAVCAVVQLIGQRTTHGGACGDERLIAAFIDQTGDSGRRGGNGGNLLQRDADGDGVGSGVGVVLRFAVAVQIDFTDFDGDLDSADVVLRGQGAAVQRRVFAACADLKGRSALRAAHKAVQVKRLAAARDAYRICDGGRLVGHVDVRSNACRLCGEHIVSRILSGKLYSTNSYRLICANHVISYDAYCTAEIDRYFFTAYKIFDRTAGKRNMIVAFLIIARGQQQDR